MTNSLWLIKFGLLLGVLFGLSGCDISNNHNKTTEPTSHVLVDVQKVNEEDYLLYTQVTGEVKARVQSVLSFRIAGKVTERRVNVGNYVHAGDVLAVLDNTEQLTGLAVAQAALSSDLAILDRKEKTYSRYKALLSSKAISEADYDRAFAEQASAHSNVLSAKADLAVARDNLSYTELKATTDGVITSISMEVGQVVSAAQSILTIADTNSKEAVFDVSATYLLPGKPLKTVSVYPVAHTEDRRDATIREISPVIDTTTGTIKVKITLPVSTPWSLGTSVISNFKQPVHRGIIVPSTSIDSQLGEPSVWVLNTETNKVSMRRVTISRYRSQDIVITGGLHPGEYVVTKGVRFLNEGQIVSWRTISHESI